MEGKNNMVKIDGKLTDATFQVISEAVHIDEDGHHVYVFCVDVFRIEPFDIYGYIMGVFNEYVHEKYNVKEDDRLHLELNYAVDKRIGDIYNI